MHSAFFLSLALFVRVSWAFSHVLLHAAVTYTCINALPKLYISDLTVQPTPTLWWHHSLPANEKNSRVNGQMGRISLLGCSGSNGCSSPQPHLIVLASITGQSSTLAVLSAINLFPTPGMERVEEGSQCFTTAEGQSAVIISVLNPPLKICFTETLVYMLYFL